MAGLMPVDRNYYVRLGASSWEFSFPPYLLPSELPLNPFNIILVHFNIHRFYLVFPQGRENMSAATISKNHLTKGLDKQTKVMDHTVSDIGSIPATSQAVVLTPGTSSSRTSWTRIVTVISLAVLLAPAIYLRSFFQPGELPINPTDYAARTKRALSQTPLIDGHNDLPYLIRVELQNKIYDGFDLKHKLLGHTDIHRMRAGQVGGQFWSCYVQCPGVVNPELYKQENLDEPTVSSTSCEKFRKVRLVILMCCSGLFEIRWSKLTLQND
jgi:hypothetical protein